MQTGARAPHWPEAKIVKRRKKMPHPHILTKTLRQITDTTRTVLERLYAQPSRSIENADAAFYKASGVMELWAELTFDMDVSEHINSNVQNELNQLVRALDTAELARWDLPPRQL